MLTWTEGQYEDGSRWIKATTGDRLAYTAELMPDGGWALFRKWTRTLVRDDDGAIGVAKNAEAIKVKATEDLQKWDRILGEMVMPF